MLINGISFQYRVDLRRNSTDPDVKDTIIDWNCWDLDYCCVSYEKRNHAAYYFTKENHQLSWVCWIVIEKSSGCCCLHLLEICPIIPVGNSRILTLKKTRNYFSFHFIIDSRCVWVKIEGKWMLPAVLSLSFPSY